MTTRAVIWCAVSSEAQKQGISLDKQERLAREFAEKNGFDIVHVFWWDGYSRWEADPIAALEDFANEGRFEYHKLREMWRAKAFDVYICYTHSRAARSFTMQSWVIENIVRSGARVYRIMGGWIDSTDYGAQIAIGGMSTTSEVDRLVRDRAEAIVHLAGRGIPPTNWVPMTHRLVRDQRSGRATHVEVREERRPLWDAVARVFLEGVAAQKIEDELFTRYGFGDESGRPYKPGTFYRVLKYPSTWGHNSIRWRRKIKKQYEQGLWAFDPSIAPPEGIQLFYDTMPPLYTGEQATHLQAELRRRSTVTNGAASRYSQYKLTGLLLCDECHHRLVYNTKSDPRNGKRYGSVRCPYARTSSLRYEVCEWTGQLSENAILDWLKMRLHEWISQRAVFFTDSPKQTQDHSDTLHQIDADIEKLTAQFDALVYELSLSDDDIKPAIRKQMRVLKDRIANQETYRATLYQEVVRGEHIEASQTQTLDTIIEMGAERFWALDNFTINQMLHSLFGTNCIVIRRREIIGFFDTRLLNQPRNT